MAANMNAVAAVTLNKWWVLPSPPALLHG